MKIKSCSRKTHRCPMQYCYGMVSLASINAYVLYKLETEGNQQIICEALWVSCNTASATLSRKLPPLKKLTFRNIAIPKHSLWANQTAAASKWTSWVMRFLSKNSKQSCGKLLPGVPACRLHSIQIFTDEFVWRCNYNGHYCIVDE